MSQPAAAAGGAGSSRAANNNANDQSETKIKIHIKSQDGTMVVYGIRRKVKLSVLFHNYCEKKQLDYRTARFFHEGHRVLGKYTADKLELKDGAEIYCMFHQNGGGFFIMPKTA